MNQKVEQCKADIAALQEQLKKLEEENKIKDIKYGQVYENSVGSRYLVVQYSGGAYQLIGLDSQPGNRWIDNIRTNSQITDYLNKGNWKYVGMFNDLFRRV